MENKRLVPLIERIGNLLRSEDRAVGAIEGLQSVHIQMLGFLSQCNRYSNTPMGVSEFLGITKGTTSQSINVLEKRGFITKVPDKDDKRVIHLHLTKKSERFIKEQTQSTDLVNTLSSNETELLSNLLTKVLAQLQLQNDRKPFGVCNSCKYFRKLGLGKSHQCGLTLEPLSEEESLLICREHQSAA